MKQLLGGIARITRIAQGGEDCPGLSGLPGLPRITKIAQGGKEAETMARAILVLRAFLLLEHEEKLAHGLGWEKETIVWFDLVKRLL